MVEWYWDEVEGGGWHIRRLLGEALPADECLEAALEFFEPRYEPMLAPDGVHYTDPHGQRWRVSLDAAARLGAALLAGVSPGTALEAWSVSEPAEAYLGEASDR